jgi:hypothetical protein
MFQIASFTQKPYSGHTRKFIGEFLRRYTVFHRFGQAKFVNGVWIISQVNFFLLPQLPQKTQLLSKVVKTTSSVARGNAMGHLTPPSQAQLSKHMIELSFITLSTKA